MGDGWRLRHGVNKFVADNVQSVQATFIVGLQHHFNRTDQFGQGRVIPHTGYLSNHITANGVKERHALRADHCDIALNAFIGPCFHIRQQLFEQVNVQATAQTTVGRHHQVAHAFNVAFFQVRVLIFQITIRKVTNHFAHGLCIRTAGRHAILRFTHFGSGDHLHRFSDLLRVLDACDLTTYLFCAGHELLLNALRSTLKQTARRYQDWVALKESRIAFSLPSISSL